MTPNAYHAARRLMTQGATPGERESARLRVEEYERRHGKPRKPIPELRRTRAPAGDSGINAYPARAVCVFCHKDWMWHFLASTGAFAFSCKNFAPVTRPAYEGPKRPPVPWWILEIRRASGRRMGLTAEYRQVLRSVRREIEDDPRRILPLGWGCYTVPDETAQRIERGEVDWTWFPERETPSGTPAWRPPPEMRAAMKAQKGQRR